ncbi:MAG: hypothetical protein LKJ44_03710 [Bifidobacteriaceae bacterium]|nr:hypothetical protein [Bifidobacteriaceae bacterium]MCI1978805.1 hypothetical protein [Bifidobacteriaceae bacterium]
MRTHHTLNIAVTVVIRLALAVFAGWVLSSSWNWPMVITLIVACVIFNFVPLFRFVEARRPEEDFFCVFLGTVAFVFCTIISGQTMTLPGGSAQGYGWAGWVLPVWVAVAQGIVLFRQWRNERRREDLDSKGTDPRNSDPQVLDPQSLVRRHIRSVSSQRSGNSQK